MARTLYTCRCIVGGGSECGERFSTAARRNQHIEQQHGEIPCTHQTCGMGFNTEAEMHVHFRETPSHKRLICQHCEKEDGEFRPYQLLTVLARHIVNKHNPTREDLRAIGTDPNIYWCPVCDSAFPHLPTHTISMLHDPRHAAMMTKAEKARYYCGLCGKYYRLLGQHKLLVHEKPFRCPEAECSFATGHTDKLRRHLRMKHGMDPAAADTIVNWARVARSNASGRVLSSRVRQQVRHPNVTLNVLAEASAGLFEEALAGLA